MGHMQYKRRTCCTVSLTPKMVQFVQISKGEKHRGASVKTLLSRPLSSKKVMLAFWKYSPTSAPALLHFCLVTGPGRGPSTRRFHCTLFSWIG